MSQRHCLAGSRKARAGSCRLKVNRLKATATGCCLLKFKIPRALTGYSDSVHLISHSSKKPLPAHGGSRRLKRFKPAHVTLHTCRLAAAARTGSRDRFPLFLLWAIRPIVEGRLRARGILSIREVWRVGRHSTP